MEWARRSKFLTVLLIFFLKAKLVQVETFTGVSCDDPEGLWTVWGKTKCSFPIQPPEKLENFFEVGEKVKIYNFIAYFFLKAKLVKPESFTKVSCHDTEGLWKVWGKTEWCFPIQPPEKL